MSMHLVGPYMTTTNYRKPKQKTRTKAQQAQFEQSHKEYNKQMKRMGCHDQMMTLEDYDLYVRGIYKPKEKKPVRYEPLKEIPAYRRETPNIPSLSNGIGVATKKESQKYTGTLIKGIATMHKSNAVPIINDQQAKDISSMRR